VVGRALRVSLPIAGLFILHAIAATGRHVYIHSPARLYVICLARGTAAVALVPSLRYKDNPVVEALPSAGEMHTALSSPAQTQKSETDEVLAR